MGLLDLFKKRAKGAMKAGVIESYRVADNVGEIRLAQGSVLRFGRTACKNFEPAVGVRVYVESIGLHPLGGERAEAIVRDPADSDYERRVAVRDSESAPPLQVPRQEPVTLPTRDIDRDFLNRLSNIAAVNTLVRDGQDPERLVLAVNVDAEGTIDGDRPTVAFRFDIERTHQDQWRLLAGIDDATAYCRFWLDLKLPEAPPLDPATFDIAHTPGFEMTISMPPEYERSPLARMAFLLAWRVEGGMETPSLDAPMTVDVTVMGVELARQPHAYSFTGHPDEHWTLLKCHRGDQAFFIGLDLSTGAAEVFPRRHDVQSYQLVLDFLRTFT